MNTLHTRSIMETRTSQEPTAITSTRFLAFLASAGLEYGITYKWVGRCRHGVIEVYGAALGPFAGLVGSEEFSRETQLWTDADVNIRSMRSGSPKHTAVKNLLERLEDLYA